MDPAEVFCVEVKQYVGQWLKTLVPRLVGQAAEAQMRKFVSNQKLDETTFFEHLDEDEAVFYRKILDYAQDNQLLIKWGSKSFSLNVVNDGNNINILRGFCNLSAYGQTLFVTVGSIKSKVHNGELIVNEYSILKDFATKISDGYGFNIKEMDDEQTDRLYEVLSRVIESIESDVWMRN